MNVLGIVYCTVLYSEKVYGSQVSENQFWLLDILTSSESVLTKQKINVLVKIK